MHSCLKGKRIALFGASGGIGSQLCRYILQLGGTLITVDRNPAKSAALLEVLQSEFPDSQITPLLADLEELSHIKRLCDELIALDVDVLIHNAGAYSIPRKLCDTGLDNVFQINFFAPYYITKRLLPHLERKGGRVVAVGSIAHNYSKTDPEDIDFSTRKQANLAYGNAKRYLMFSLSALFKNETEVTLAVTHPGITATNITAHYPKVIYALIKYPMRVIFMRPRRAVLSLLAGVFSETKENEWLGPRFFDIWGTPKKKRLRSVSENERLAIARIADEVFFHSQTQANM